MTTLKCQKDTMQASREVDTGLPYPAHMTVPMIALIRARTAVKEGLKERCIMNMYNECRQFEGVVLMIENKDYAFAQ